MRHLHVSDGLILAIGEKGFRSLAVVRLRIARAGNL